MTFTTVRVPFAVDLLERLATDLLCELDPDGEGDLSAGLVVLPSARACRTLGMRLLEQSGRDTLLLPRIETLSQWAETATLALGLAESESPADSLRGVILAREMAGLSWLQGREGSAPGLAEDFVGFFDETRLHEMTLLLEEPLPDQELIRLAGAAGADIAAADLARAREVWRIYRRVIPVDEVDRLVDLAETLADGAARAGCVPRLALVAGFGRLDPIRAKLVDRILVDSDKGRSYLPTSTSTLSRVFCATWSNEAEGTGPLAPTGRIEQLLPGHSAGAAAIAVNEGGAVVPLRERLVEIGDSVDLLAPDGPLELMPCADPEIESRAVADRVVEILQQTPEAEQRIGVAVGDPGLAARIVAQLIDAGLDPDNSHGQPLSVLPAGLLVRFLMRAALTDLRAESLLEVLTHPYVRLPLSEGGHGLWTLRLERLFRRGSIPAGGLAGLQAHATDRDESARRLFPDQRDGMVEFIEAIAAGFEPLLAVAGGQPRAWQEYVSALRETWTRLVPELPLAESRERADVNAAARLLALIESDGHRLPPVTLAGFSADMTRLLAGQDVAPHRARHLPVQVLGLVEARLERFDRLIVAGLNDGVFPSRTRRPLLLGGRIRDRLGLPSWRDGLGRDSELFLRLLHAAPRALLTWATECEGEPALPSPFVTRLQLGAGTIGTIGTVVDRPLWRVGDSGPTPAAPSRPTATRPEAQVPLRTLNELSWSALRLWRDCPYRFLLERGFALRPAEEVQEEFGRQEYGSLVHAALHSFLEPGGDGLAALKQGDAILATEFLDAAAAAAFLPGSEALPVRRLWLESFRRLVPGLVKHEITRAADWTPLALEAGFRISLTQVRDWAHQLAGDLGVSAGLPTGAIPEDVVLRGTIDRVDCRSDGGPGLAIIDYKTGKLPSGKSVENLKDLQIALYSIAVEAGGLAEVAAIGSRVAEAFYYGLTDTGIGPPKNGPHLALASPEGRLLLLRAAGRLLELSAAAAAGQGEFPLLPAEYAGDGESHLPCSHCDFRGVCRIEERPMPPDLEIKLDSLVNRKEVG